MTDAVIIFGAKYLVLISVIVFVWFFIKQPRDKQKQILVFTIITLPLIYAVAKLLSLVYYDPRPFIVGHFMPLIPHDPDNGFPSDHTLFASAVAAIVFFYNKKTGLALFFIALLIGISRVLAGVHHPVDVGGSIIIAVAVSFAVYKIILPKIIKLKMQSFYFK
jgi:undecaprenyl-diphosphatase